MSKLRILIYSTILLVILLALFISIFALVKKNNNQNTSIIPTPTSIPVIKEITWPEAVNLIQNCKIKSIFQKRKLEVTLTDKEGTVLKTIEPKFNDIFNEINHLRSDCNDIIQAITE
jgi:isocitrate dehydrogenase